jgi:ATP-dependent Lhr-like helicase
LRIGLSATQNPIAEVARFLLGGFADGATDRTCTIVDTGHRRKMDLGLELPGSPLQAVMAMEVWGEVYGRLVELIGAHRTTLIFVNTRRMAERVARALSERLGPEQVTSHHGSLSREQRLLAEQRLKAGELRALVATASLELGIDIGSVDLVCQLGSVRAIATLLQRAGRSGHQRRAIPKARLFPLTRDELVEAAALLDAVRRGELDCLSAPRNPLDLLAQHIVAMAAVEEWNLDELFAAVRRSYTYRELTREDFDAVIAMLGWGFAGARGRFGAYLHVDAVNRRVRGRRGAQLAAITNGGAIPDNADYDVVVDATNGFVGTVNEDFAIESMAGDIFQLGNTSWRIVRVEPGKVRVDDAKGQPPTIPFWLGEAPGRTAALSFAVARLREHVDRILSTGEPPPMIPAGPDPVTSLLPPANGQAARLGPQVPLPGIPNDGQRDTRIPAEPYFSEPAPVPRLAPTVTADLRPLMAWLTGELALEDRAAVQLAEYLAGAWGALGVLPTQDTLVIERFFDEVGGMQMIVHAPFGSRLNRAWGLSLRKRFCRQFNFELQAAATEDAILLSLGPTHSFPLEEVYRYLRTANVRDILVQALLAAPMFEVRWRHNANRSLAVLRRQGGRKIPPAFQRMRAADLLTVVFPDQVACAENLTGPREVPDHPLVKQTVRDCLEEVMDIAGLETLLGRIERGELRLEVRDLTAPSPLAMEILNARPYSFLDDAPLEERRTQAVMQRRWLDPETAGTLGALDADAIAQVRLEAWPAVSSADELHDALMTLGALTELEGMLGERAPLGLRAASSGADAPAPRLPAALAEDAGWSPHLAALQADGRACRIRVHGQNGERVLWAATEWRALWRLIHPGAAFDPAPEPPAGIGLDAEHRDGALLMAVRARLLGSGPITAAVLAQELGVPPADIEGPLAGVEAQGLALRGRYTPGADETEWCERGLLARIHRYTLNRLRREIEPVSAADYMRFLLRWHRVAPGFRREDEEGLLEALQQLEGFEAPAASWESELLPARMKSYDGTKLDRLCLAGRAVWARLSPPTGVRRAGPVATTPIVVMQRPQMPLWWSLARPAPAATDRPPAGRTSPAPAPEAGDPDDAGISSPALQAREWLASHGASFFSDIVSGTGLLPTQAEDALGELVYMGLATADSFSGLRTLLTPAARKAPVRPGKLWNGPMEGAGRWALLKPPGGIESRSNRPSDEDAEGLAYTLLRRYGVLFRRVMERERLAPRWGDLVRVLRRLEARGLIRGGHFITGVTGEQFALPEAVTALRELRRSALSGDLIAVSAADPLNLCGIVVGSRRLAALSGNRVVYRDGLPIAAREADQIVPLTPLSDGELWACRLVLEGRPGLQRGAPLRLPN